MKRRPIAELLDTDSGTPEQIAASLSDLQRINRWFGGISTARALVERVAERTRSSRLSLLEIASGAGYVPRTVHERLRKAGIELDVTLLDRSSSHLDHFARSVAGDVLALPFRDASFDLVSCTLFAHHLSPEEFVQFVSEGLRVCGVAVQREAPPDSLEAQALGIVSGSDLDDRPVGGAVDRGLDAVEVAGDGHVHGPRGRGEEESGDQGERHARHLGRPSSNAHAG